MPFGPINAQSTFQQMIDAVSTDLKLAWVYTAVVLLLSESIDDHVKHLKAVLYRTSGCSSRQKLSKLCLAHQKVFLLDHIVEKEGVQVDVEKVFAIKKKPLP